MKFSIKMIWLGIAGAFLLGAVFMVIGFFAGASTQGYVDRDGIHIAARHAGEAIQIQDTGISAFSDVKIDAAYCDVRFKPADEYGVEILYYGEKPAYERKGDELTIQSRERWRGTRFNFSIIGHGWEPRDTIIISYPEDAHFGHIAVHVAAGKLEMQSVNAKSAVEISNDLGETILGEINVGTLKLISSAGKVSTEKIEAREWVDIRADLGDVRIEKFKAETLKLKLSAGNAQIKDGTADSMEIQNSLGNIEVEKVAAARSEIKNNAGNVQLRGDFGSARISNDLGNIIFHTSKPKGQYVYDFTVDLGNITIDGDRTGNSASGGNGPNRLVMNASCGNIEARFSAK